MNGTLHRAAERGLCPVMAFGRHDRGLATAAPAIGLRALGAGAD